MAAQHPLPTGLAGQFEQIARLVKARQRQPALAHMQRLVEQFGDQPLVLFEASKLALHLEAIGYARTWASQLSKLDIAEWQAALKLVDLLRGAGLSTAARRYVEQLCERFPDQPVLVSKAASLAAARGDRDAARHQYRAALQLEPALTAPYLFLARDDATDPAALLAAMEALDAENLSTVQKANLLIARGHCLQRLERARDCFAAFAAARQLTHEPGQGAALERQINSANALLKDFSSARVQALRARGHSSSKPVFVVGMPRSGSTLVAQVLGAHPQVSTLGERRFLGTIVHDQFTARSAQSSLLDALATPPGSLLELGDQYLQMAGQSGAPEAARWIDKMPFNFSLTGPAHVIFPQGHTVYMRRDPLDTCWSMFTAAFALKSLQLSLTEIGQLHALSEHLMQRWQALLPEAIIEVSYEHWVDQFETQAPHLVEGIGLNWDPACLAFHRQGNEVLTASDIQVHQPVYASSVGRSQPFRGWLDEFVQAREATLQRLRGAQDSCN